MNVPDKAVEAAANAMVIASPDLSGWDDLNEAEIDWYMRDARAALEAAAPYIQAQALREQADRYDNPVSENGGQVFFGCEIASEARRRADELEAGGD